VKLTKRSDVPGRTLTGGGYASDTLMTDEACITYCQSNGFVYAGTEYSSQCCKFSAGKEKSYAKMQQIVVLFWPRVQDLQPQRTAVCHVQEILRRPVEGQTG
jgi:WSC domain